MYNDLSKIFCEAVTAPIVLDIAIFIFCISLWNEQQQQGFWMQEKLAIGRSNTGHVTRVFIKSGCLLD